MTNLVLICWDAARSDRLSCNGYERKTTPVLDELDKVLFTDVVSASTHTCQSLASILTGTYASRHKRYDGDLAPAVPTVFSHLKNFGYSSCVFTQHPLSDIYGSDEMGGPGVGGSRIVGSFERWLNKGDREPFVVLLHFLETHDWGYHTRGNSNVWTQGLADKFYPVPQGDFNRIEPLEERICIWIAVQDAGMFVLDSLLTCVLDKVPPDTLVVVFSDHGDEFYEHGRLSHGQTIYNEVVFSFCAFVGIRGNANARWVSGIDIIPTSLALLDLPIPPWMQGVNVLEVKGERLEKPAIVELYKAKGNWATANWAAIYQHDRKLIINFTTGERQLFDPVRDRGEHTPLDEPDQSERLYDSLIRIIEDAHIRFPREPVCFYEDKKVVARLKELGYLE